ncbi:hypothetical protein GGD61_004958 [Bradyrhizobium sp. SBR1B]|nr:hypothetical protein [Bradyrhizobium sp. SBR1B]
MKIVASGLYTDETVADSNRRIARGGYRGCAIHRASYSHGPCRCSVPNQQTRPGNETKHQDPDGVGESQKCKNSRELQETFGEKLDVIGVGIGPLNLSLAALIEPTPLRALFLEKRNTLVWHPGLVLPNSRLQVSSDGYRISTKTTTYLARAVVVGVGVEPKIPDCARSLPCETVYHAADYLERQRPHAAEHVLVVAGGQSGAEIIEDILTRSASTQITWATSRSSLFSMDDNSFVNEACTPAYSRRFHARKSLGAMVVGVPPPKCTSLTGKAPATWVATKPISSRNAVK